LESSRLPPGIPDELNTLVVVAFLSAKFLTYICQLEKLCGDFSAHLNRDVRVDIKGCQNVKFDIGSNATQEATTLIVFPERVSHHLYAYLM
jgi:hypothetical protein